MARRLVHQDHGQHFEEAICKLRDRKSYYNECFDQLSDLLQAAGHAIGHFTAACSVTWPLNGSEAGGDIALIQTSRRVSHANAH